MHSLNLPPYPIQLKEKEGKTYIFDRIRKKYLLLTPEEWVRQNFVWFLIEEKKYVGGLMAIEKGLKLNDMHKRADVVVYDELAQPIALIECKAPKVKINQDVFEQISRYNLVFKVPYLLVTNGLSHYCVKIDFKQNTFSFLEEIPNYEQLTL